MNSIYDRAYEDLYADYVYEERRHFRQFFLSEYDLIRTIRRAIDRNSTDTKKTIRSDARYFLLVNFHQMIILPLLEVRTFPDFDKQEQELNQAISDDIATIIASAVSQAEYDKDEVSGHEIMRAIDNLWKQLKTTKFEIWG